MPLNLLVTRHDPKITFYLPPELIKDLQQAARQSRRKLMTEIIVRLGRTFRFKTQYQMILPLIQSEWIPWETLPIDCSTTTLRTQFQHRHQAIQQYFEQATGFIVLQERFPQDLLQALTQEATLSGLKFTAILASRLKVTLEEPGWFGWPMRRGR